MHAKQYIVRITLCTGNHMITRWQQLVLAIGIFLGTAVISQAQPSPAPRVWSIEADTVSAQTITFTVEFNEPVTGVDTSDFSITGDTAFATISRVTTTATQNTYDVDVALHNTSTKLALVLLDDDSIINATKTPLGGVGTQNGNAVSPAVIPPPMQRTSSRTQSIHAPSTYLDGKIVGSHASLALTSADVPVISYYDYNNSDPKLAICDRPACTSPHIVTLDENGTSGNYSSVAITSTDIPVVSYYHFDFQYLRIATCTTARCASVNVANVDTTGDVGQYSSIAMTSTNRPVISYWDATNENLKLAVCNDMFCGTPALYTIDVGGNVGQYTSIALTTNDIPVISYYDQTNTNLKLAVCNNLVCNNPTIDTIDATGDVGGYTSIAMSSNNTPVISYYDFGNNSLKIAICQDTPCTTSTIRTKSLVESNIGQYSSIALSSDDIPVISHYDNNGFDLLLTQCYDASCSSEITSRVDTASDVGQYSSIAITSNNTPMIGYHDATNGYLKLYQAPTMVDNGRPNTFAKYFPVNNATNYGSTVYLSWQPSVGATSYEYCIATSVTDCTTWISTTSTDATATNLIRNTTYYWQVRALNEAGQTAANANTIWNFSVFTPKITDDRIYVGYYNDIQITSNNTPVVSFSDSTADQLKLAICESLICLEPLVRTIANAGASTSLALTGANVPIISYNDGTNGDLHLAICNDMDCDAPTITVVDNAATNVGWESSLDLTSAGIPVISYVDINNSKLKLAICNTLTCTSPTIRQFDIDGVSASHTELVLTSDNKPVIAFYDNGTHDLKLAVCDTLTCANPTITTIDSAGSVGINPSMVLTSDDSPIISYSDLTDGAFMLATCDDTTCANPSIRTITTGGTWSGWYSGMALTSDELPVISYYDDTTADINVVYCHTTRCQASNTQVIESIGVVGENNAIALTTEDIAVVSYVNNDVGNLKLDIAPRTIYKGEPADFATIAPANNATMIYPRVTFSWGAVTGTTNYEYCISTSLVCTTWTSTGTNTSTTLTGITHNTTYYWYVRASNAAGTTVSNNGAPSRFTTVFLPGSFSKSAPLDKAKNQKTSVTLQWTTSTYATSYEYCISLSTVSCTTWISTGAARGVTVTNLAKGKTYQWQVRAKTSSGTVVANSGVTWKFTTAP